MKTNGGQSRQRVAGMQRKKLNTEGTEFAAQRTRRRARHATTRNRDWQDSWARGNGEAIAMVGWGHLCLPFTRPRKWRCAAVSSGEWCRPGKRWTGPLQRTARRNAPGRPATDSGGQGSGPRIEKRIAGGARLVKYYYKQMVNRSNGAAEPKPAASKTKAAAPSMTLSALSRDTKSWRAAGSFFS